MKFYVFLLLAFLIIQGNLLTGPIPSTFGFLTNAIVIDLHVSGILLAGN
jgi:hypothetical protein